MFRHDLDQINDGLDRSLTIYPAYIHNNQLKQFTPTKFREIDSSDAPGIALKVFSFLIGIVGGAHLHNPLFFKASMPDTNLLTMGLSSLKKLSDRGKVYLPINDQFPHIDQRYVSASIADWIKLGEEREEHSIPPKDNPYYRNMLTYIPTLKDNWSLVYIISLRSPQEFEEKGLDYGHITLTRNDAVELCKQIVAGKFLPPYEPLKKLESDTEESCEHSTEFSSEAESSEEQNSKGRSFNFDESDLEESWEPSGKPEDRIFEFDEELSENNNEKELSENNNRKLIDSQKVASSTNKMSSGPHIFQHRKTKAIDIPTPKAAYRNDDDFRNNNNQSY